MRYTKEFIIEFKEPIYIDGSLIYSAIIKAKEKNEYLLVNGNPKTDAEIRSEKPEDVKTRLEKIKISTMEARAKINKLRYWYVGMEV